MGRLTLVIGVGDGAEALLPRSIPNLQFHILIIRLHRFEPKVHSNRRHVVFVKLVVCEPQQQTRFPDRRIADDHVLEEVVILSASPCHLSLFKLLYDINRQPLYYPSIYFILLIYYAKLIKILLKIIKGNFQ